MILISYFCEFVRLVLLICNIIIRLEEPLIDFKDDFLSSKSKKIFFRFLSGNDMLFRIISRTHQFFYVLL